MPRRRPRRKQPKTLAAELADENRKAVLLLAEKARNAAYYRHGFKQDVGGEAEAKWYLAELAVKAGL